MRKIFCSSYQLPNVLYLLKDCSELLWELLGKKHSVCSAQPQVSSMVVLGHFTHTLSGGAHSCADSGAQLWQSHFARRFLTALGGMLSLAEKRGCLCLPTAPGNLQKSQDFQPIPAGVWQYPVTVWTVSWWRIYSPHITMIGGVGGSSKEGCVQMLTWGSKAVMSNRCHIGLRLGNLQSLSFLAHTFLSTKACGTQDAQI